MTTTTQTAFGAALKQARIQRGMSQERLAEHADISHSYLSRLECGTRNPTRETVLALTAALGCDDLETDELLVASGFTPESDEMRLVLARVMRWERQRRLKRAEWKAMA